MKSHFQTSPQLFREWFKYILTVELCKATNAYIQYKPNTSPILKDFWVNPVPQTLLNIFKKVIKNVLLQLKAHKQILSQWRESNPLTSDYQILDFELVPTFLLETQLF